MAISLRTIRKRAEAQNAPNEASRQRHWRSVEIVKATLTRADTPFVVHYGKHNNALIEITHLNQKLPVVTVPDLRNPTSSNVSRYVKDDNGAFVVDASTERVYVVMRRLVIVQERYADNHEIISDSVKHKLIYTPVV